MKERIKIIRKSNVHGETQSSFASFLGVSKENIASYESGRRNPSDSFISLLCQKCGVNRSWVLTGEGEPFAERTQNDIVAEFVGHILNDYPDTDFKKRFIVALASMDEKFWDAMKEFGEKLLEEQKKE